MKEKQTFIIKVTSEEIARKRATEWYAHKKNLSIDSVKPYSKGGYIVSISYDKKYSK